VKLIFVNRFFYPDHSATSQILGDLAFHLARDPSREVCVVTSRQRYDDPAERLAAREAIDGVAIRRVWTTHFGRGWLPGRALDYLSFYASAGLALWRLTGRGDIVVAKTDPPLISVVVALVARLRGAKLVNWVQDAFPEVAQALGMRVPLANTLRALRNRSLRFAAANVVLGDRMAAWAREQGVTDRHLAVIPNWADGDAIHPLVHEANPLRAEWGLAGKFVVAYSGNLGRAHDVETMLDAADLLRGESDIVFLFIGGGHGHGALDAAVAARALQSVRLMPYQPRDCLAQSLGVADLHWVSLFPALEGLIVPSKIYGVLAAGRPAVMVGDADGEIGRLLARRECGVAVDVGAAADLAAAILRLRGAPELRQRMGRDARAAFDAHYSREQGFLAWERLVANVARR
jgi:colanic acid biosynthesis glycosyl transferase WcaI